MIYKVHTNLRDNSIIPFNYKSNLNSWIYESIKKFNAETFHTFHDNKLFIGGRPFKPFVFSNLFFKNREIFKNYGYLVQGEGTWYFSSCNKTIEDAFLEGLKDNIKIGNLLISVKKVEKINILKKDSDIFKTLSPVVVSIKEGKLRKQLEPIDKTYIDRIKTNIIKKYEYLHKESISPNDFDIKIISYNPDGVLENYKDMPIKAYDCMFKVNGDDKLKETICTLGIGVFNCMGFGFVLPYKMS